MELSNLSRASFNPSRLRDSVFESVSEKQVKIGKNWQIGTGSGHIAGQVAVSQVIVKQHFGTGRAGWAAFLGI
jgi:hypothetical protein